MRQNTVLKRTIQKKKIKGNRFNVVVMMVVMIIMMVVMMSMMVVMMIMMVITESVSSK